MSRIVPTNRIYRGKRVDMWTFYYSHGKLWFTHYKKLGGWKVRFLRNDEIDVEDFF